MMVTESGSGPPGVGSRLIFKKKLFLKKCILACLSENYVQFISNTQQLDNFTLSLYKMQCTTYKEDYWLQDKTSGYFIRMVTESTMK